MVKARFALIDATINDGQWTSKDPELARLLNSLRPLYGVSGAEPDRDLALANYAISLIGGEILESDPPEAEEGVIY